MSEIRLDDVGDFLEKHYRDGTGMLRPAAEWQGKIEFLHSVQDGVLETVMRILEKEFDEEDGPGSMINRFFYLKNKHVVDEKMVRNLREAVMSLRVAIGDVNRVVVQPNVDHAELHNIVGRLERRITDAGGEL